MQFILWYRFTPENTKKVLDLWKKFKYPKDVKVIHRCIVIGRHASVAIFDAPNEEAILKITGPFSPYGVAKVAPIMPLEKAIEVEF